MNGLMRLIWAYLHRCPESSSATTTKLDNLLKYFFPPNRISIFPNDERLEPFIYIIHFILSSRNFDYGRDLCLELMQESAVNAAHQSGANVLNVLAPERTAIAVQAILLSLSVIERDAGAPAWPSSSDFNTVASFRGDYPSSSDFVPPSFLSKPGMQEFFDRCGTTLGFIAVACSNAIGSMSLFDEQWSASKVTVGYEESHNFVVRSHPEAGNVVYPSHLVPHITLLQTVFQAWPRCLHPSLSLGDAIDMLLRGVIHVEPLLGEAACATLKRFMGDQSHLTAVLSRFNTFLFNPRSSQDVSGNRLLIESRQLLDLWANVVDGWVQSLLKRSQQSLGEDEKLISSRCNEIEAGALFLLSHESRDISLVGVKIVRILGLFMSYMTPKNYDPEDGHITSMYFVERLHGRDLDDSYLNGYDELLDKAELARLEQWRQSKRVDVPLRIADSNNEKDRKIWRFAYPAFMQLNAEIPSQSLAIFRDIVVAASSRLHPSISVLAGLSNRIPAGRTPAHLERDGLKQIKDKKSLIEQWYVWVKILCSIASLPDSSRPALVGRDHSRAPSADANSNFERERLTTTRGLFRYLTPFLDSEYTLFRDAAVLCISSFPSFAYPHLLEDLSLLAGRQIYDDQRSKAGVLIEQNRDDARSKALMSVAEERTRRQERLHSAVARIYYLTAHLLDSQRSTGRSTALTNVLKFVRNTQAFLTSPEMRDNYTLQRLRRYFCGTVERLFDGLSSLKDSDRFIQRHTLPTLYRLCEEWCQFGHQSDGVKQRLLVMERAATSASPQSEVSEAIERFQSETRLLSYASVGALASLYVRSSFPASVLLTVFEFRTNRLSLPHH